MCIADASTYTGNSGEIPGRPGRCNRCDGEFLRQILHFLSAIVEKLLTRDAAESDSREGMQWTHRESEDLPLTGRDVTFLGEVRAES